MIWTMPLVLVVDKSKGIPSSGKTRILLTTCLRNQIALVNVIELDLTGEGGVE